MPEKLSIETVNQMGQGEFIRRFGAVFEDTPEIAKQAWTQRPFADVVDLHQKMVTVVEQLSAAAQIDLICAHPDLGSRAKMADASVQEQAGAGLDQLDATEYERFQTLNGAYKDKFGFPFILAVKGHTKVTILAAFETRLQHSQTQEQTQALSEIAQIARFRLADLMD